MFEGPEYESYIALCRELRLEREWLPGDVYLGLLARPITCGPEWTPDHGMPWLPRLDQWLAMIRMVGNLRNLRLYFPMTVEDDFVAKAYFADDRTIEARAGDSLEEAVARLWKAVVDEIAQREGVTSY